MAEIKRIEYSIIFTFAKGEDLIKYVTSRQCTDLDSMIDYCFSWADKYSDKYGELLEIKIYESVQKHVLVYENAIC